MRVSDFDYELPEELIADRPPINRGDSRLMVVNKKSDAIEHRKYSNLAAYLNDGDVVVLNDTRVIKARLLTMNSEGQGREIFLLEEHGNNNRETSKVLYRGKLKVGEKLFIKNDVLEILKIYDGGIADVHSRVSLQELASRFGEVPLPPYMKRRADKEDVERYQTVFADREGSVAAPTASLNFTHELITRLESKGVIVCKLTLHVGLGTFLPIRTENLSEHEMHSEYFEIPPETIKMIKNAKQNRCKIVAIGTTVTRTLEFCADSIISAKDDSEGLKGEANIFIYPGYKFKIVDAMLTNFHAPKSTVLMMASAFAGKEKLAYAYEEAKNRGYKFLSYGDSMLII